ncbi:hypothetical protein y223_00027 [Bordetella phage PY223]
MPVLIDGREVASDSEEWRHECEARHVASQPTQIDRRNYLDDVRARRGDAAAQQLERLARKIYHMRVQSKRAA